MSIEGYNSTESVEEQTKQIRRKYLEAMAVGIGANPLTAKLSVEALLAASGELSNLDYSKDRDESDPQTIEQIEAIGKWFLSGSEQADQLKFTAGTGVLRLLSEKPDGGSFKYVKNWVSYWTDGTGEAKYEEYLNKEEN